MRPGWSTTLLAVVTLLIGGAAVLEAEPPSLTGAEAPGFDLQSLEGDRLSLADLRGQFVVLHFGAGW